MHTETIEYQLDEKNFRGYVAYDNASGAKKPGILVAHAWRGQDDFAREKARQLAELGYIGFAVDMYGDAKEVSSDEDAANLMIPLFINRKELRRRIVAAFEVLRNHPLVDANRISAIGFCFGGLTVIELLRSGSQLHKVVSFHGVLGDTMGQTKAILELPAQKLNGALLLLHGYEDPLVSANDISSIQREFSDAGVDWQMHIYSHTTHAFTNPHANDPKKGMHYQPKSAVRAWQSMINFLQETF